MESAETIDRLSIPFGDGDESVSGRLHRPVRDLGRSVVLLAHGAGAGMDSPFMRTVASGLAAAGLPVLRFAYAYAERAREGAPRAPDRRPKLEAVHRAALARLAEAFPGRALLLAGKSMGGRIASYLAAEGEPCAGLAFLGYPLHPPGKSERPRSEHFPKVRVPALFLAGTRDALSDLALLQREVTRFAGPVTLHVIEGADHGFRVPKRLGRASEDVLEELVRVIVEWEAGLETGPSSPPS